MINDGLNKECYKDERTWYAIKSAIVMLEKISKELGVRVDDIATLWDHLHMWDPKERVCYGEFWSRIRGIVMHIAIKSKNKPLAEKVLRTISELHTHEEFRGIVKDALELLRHK